MPTKEYREKNREKLKEESRLYRENNKEKIKESARIYRETHQDVIKKSQKPYWLKRNYNLTLEEHNALLENGCNVCGTKEGRLCVDHDHKTGLVRGCLCTRCNVALGGYEYVLDNLDKFTKYLGGTHHED